MVNVNLWNLNIGQIITWINCSRINILVHSDEYATLDPHEDNDGGYAVAGPPAASSSSSGIAAGPRHIGPIRLPGPGGHHHHQQQQQSTALLGSSTNSLSSTSSSGDGGGHRAGMAPPADGAFL